jgi:hypothetical protein
MFRLPFGDGREPIANQQRPTRGPRHPRRNADSFGCGSVDDTIMNVGIDGDRQLR